MSEPFNLESESIESIGSHPAVVAGVLDLRCCDCMELMREFPDKHFDLAIVDPPYGINFAKTHTGNGWTVRESKDWDKSTPPP